MTYDLVLVGGGLANGLIAYRLAQLRPDLSVLVLEQDARPGGNHTWSFHESDLTASQAAWLEPFVVNRWPGYDVLFQDRTRRIGIGYRSVASDRFAIVLEGTCGERLRCDMEVAGLAARGVTLASGERIAAGAVVDGRGPGPTERLDLAFQKFVGLEVRLTHPHGLDRPILMDATVAQTDGYRFVYVLPFEADRLLVEDTYYSDTPALDPPVLRGRIRAYLAQRGWTPSAVLREEIGVLPIALGGDIAAFWRDAPGEVARTGLRAALFHPTTGYSLPDAVRLADHIAALPDLSAGPLFAAIRDWSVRKWRSQGMFRILNRMLFRAGSPGDRHRVLRRFYGLPEPLIRRFYAGALSPIDKVRLLAGKPPVPILGAVRALLPQAGMSR